MFFPTLGVIATTDVVSVDIHANISEALQKMHRHNHRSVVVINGPLHHIITSKDMIRLKMEGVDFSSPLSQIELRTLPMLDKESNVINVLNLNTDMDEHICVCNEDGSLYGLVTNSDIVASVDPQVVLESLQLATIFDKKYGYKTFDAKTPMDEVLAYMRDAPADCVIIEEESKAVGIITSKDILKFIDGDRCHEVEAGSVMSAPIETMASTASINDALDFIKRKHYKRIVVVDEKGSIMGIITQQDLISRTYLKWSQLVNEHFHQFEELNTILHQKNKHLAKLATKDALTGVNNRHMFAEHYQKESAASKRYKNQLSLVMMDLDHFKKINDTYGHNIGDNVLKQFASIVLETIREADIFARWGGEEFVLLLKNIECQDALAVAEKIRKAVEAYSFDEAGQITCSIGICEVQDDEPLESAIERADHALYESKRRGRNQTCLSFHL